MRNVEGDSPDSDILEIALADYPIAPQPPTKIDTSSSISSIFVKWLNVPSTQIDVVGYQLWIDYGQNG
jgi:hypothetical protein